jgi:hypothetical protein
MQPYTQGDNIPEIIVPLMVAEYDDASKKLSSARELIGTGFIIGVNGFALTAAHVIDQLNEAKKESELIFTHLQNSSGFHPFSITEFEKHPHEDVGIIKLSNPNLKSWLHISKERYLHSTPYMAWGFPRENAEELKDIRENAHLFPDLIYTEGYIRRVIHHELRSIVFIGKRFYEVSDLGGAGYSGSPVLDKKTVSGRTWQVIGIYIGEKEGQGAPVGYVVPSISFFDWVPDILGCSVYDESLKGNQSLFPKKSRD